MREVYFIEQSRRLSQERKLPMLGRNPSEPALFQMVDVESLVPANHQLRKIDAVLDLSFVPEVVAECYSANRGRPSIDPELAVRMMLLGVLYDLSDRELCDEVQMHAGMRWFLGLNFHDPVPDHSTLSRLRNERWSESGLFERLMDEVIRQCSEAGLVSGRHLSVDGTEVRADASVKSLTRRGPKGPDDRDPPEASGQGKGEPKPAGEWKGHGQRYTNETHFSPTDPDARLYRKGNQRGARLSYLVHDLIDTKSRVILRRKASLATGTAERDTALEMLDEVLEARGELGLPKRPEILTGDAGYGATDLIAELLDRGIEPHVPLLAGEAAEEVPKWKRRTFNLEHKRARVRKVREVEARNRVREIHQTRGYHVSRKLRIRSEHLFAEGKNEHGLRRARRRGRERVDQQATLCAVVQNLKRLVTFRGQTDPGAAVASSATLSRAGFRPPIAHLRLFLTHVRTMVTSFASRPRSLPFPEMGTLRPMATASWL
jgi:transposase